MPLIGSGVDKDWEGEPIGEFIHGQILRIMRRRGVFIADTDRFDLIVHHVGLRTLRVKIAGDMMIECGLRRCIPEGSKALLGMSIRVVIDFDVVWTQISQRIKVTLPNAPLESRRVNPFARGHHSAGDPD